MLPTGAVMDFAASMAVMQDYRRQTQRSTEWWHCYAVCFVVWFGTKLRCDSAPIFSTAVPCLPLVGGTTTVSVSTGNVPDWIVDSSPALAFTAAWCGSLSNLWRASSRGFSLCSP